VQEDPFAELGLPALAELTDDDVRAAWRRIAAATHPDREDGGDPARFGAAAAAYALLRTSFGRGEALADLGTGAARGRRRHARGARRLRRPGGHGRRWDPWLTWDLRRPWSQRRGAHRLRAAGPARYRHAGYAGIDRGLALPAGGAALGTAVAVAAAGWTPATIGLAAGALTVTGWGLWRRAWRDR
jgi:curved DNA-binding protein CbpA